MAIGTVSNTIIPQAYTAGYAGNVKRVQWKSPLIDASELADGDIVQMGYLPAHSLVFKAEMWSTVDFDGGTETLDIDLGVAAAGNTTDQWTDPSTGVTYTNAAGTADPDAFINAGVLTGDALAAPYAGYLNYRLGLYSDMLYFSDKTLVQFEVNAAVQATPTDGYLVAVLHYYDV